MLLMTAHDPMKKDSHLKKCLKWICFQLSFIPLRDESKSIQYKSLIVVNSQFVLKVEVKNDRWFEKNISLCKNHVGLQSK